MKVKIYTIILLFLFTYLIFTISLRFAPQYIVIGAISALISSTSILFLLKKNIKQLQEVKTIDFSCIVIFITLITTPLIHNMDELHEYEKRTPTAFPEFHIGNVWTFPKGIKPFFNDAFAFRNILIKQHINLQTKFFKISSNPNMVTISENDWLFCNANSYIHECSDLLTDEELDRIVANLLFKKKVLNNRGIKFYLTIPPIKEQFYKENLPPVYKLSFKHSKLAQLKKHLEKYPEINFIDVDTVLKRHKKDKLLYYETDTHWNQLGAFYAYQEIMRTLIKDFPQLDYFKFEKMDIRTYDMPGGDLNELLGDALLFKRTAYKVKPKAGNNAYEVLPDSVLTSIPILDENLRILQNKKVNNKLKLCVFRDSFSEYLWPLFSENFSRSSYPWRRELSLKYIDHEKPDILIHEVLERFIYQMVDLPPDFEAYKQLIKEVK